MSAIHRHQVEDSRREMAKNYSKGVQPVTFIPDIASKYNRTIEATSKDWTRRKTWLPKIVKLADPIIIYELAEGLKQIIPNSWYEYTTADNTSAKIGALRLAKETYIDLIHLAIELGVKPESISSEVFTWKEPSWLQDTASTTCTEDSTNSTKAKPDSDSSPAEDDGAKQSAAQTKP